MSSKGYSDGYLQNLWHKAVRAHWSNRCARCGSPDIQCHHVVPRRKALLRNDWRNGIALCAECHAWAHQLAGRRWVESVVDIDYLTERDVILTDWLQAHGMSRKEFDKAVAEELKRKANE